MWQHLYVSSIHYGIDAPQFHYDGVHTVDPEFDEYIFTTIGEIWDKEEDGSLQNTFKNDKEDLKGWVTESRIY